MILLTKLQVSALDNPALQAKRDSEEFYTIYPPSFWYWLFDLTKLYLVPMFIMQGIFLLIVNIFTTTNYYDKANTGFIP